ncbi:MAG: TIR domain-containing protein [Rhodopirellula sp.]|nr:TIR domain-containing protein [Rhodopirellula sp.]
MAKRKRAAKRKKAGDQTEASPWPPGVTLLHTLTGHLNSVLDIAFSFDCEMLASANLDRSVKLWQASSGELLRTLNGHLRTVWSVAFDPQGGTLASGSADKTVKLWETDTGQLLRTLDGHMGEVYSVAFSPQDGTLASGSSDSTVKLWDSDTGRLLRTLEVHTDSIRSVAFSPQGGMLASGSDDNIVRVWETGSNQLLHTLDGHRAIVSRVTFSPVGGMLASGSHDNTVKVWDADSGRLLRTLEGHTRGVEGVAFSPDGRLLASKSVNHRIWLWDCETWETVADLSVPTRQDWRIPALAFGPTHSPLTRLAAASSEPYTPEYERNRLIQIWELDDALLLERGKGSRSVPSSSRDGSPSRGTVHYTSAKIVLVGDTGVGKSALAERLDKDKYVPSEKSTHARRTLLLDSQIVETEHGTQMHRETVLWDLAGQPAYRLVHQLSLDDAAVACVLFDARSETNPFDGAAYWAQVLQQTRANLQFTRFLVASRVDVGGLPASVERIQAFAQEHGFEPELFQTSALTGDGCQELLAAIRNAIDWDKLPAVSSTETLAALRAFVSRLKGERDSADEPSDESLPELLTIAELKQQFEADWGQSLSLDDFLAYLQRLQDSDVLDVLVYHTTGQSPRLEDRVLLDATRIDAYASALLVAAKDEPDGPGHLLESRIHAGNFKLEASERLSSKADERHVLWYVIENLLTRDLALRKTINGEDYVVFPAQCTSPLVFPGGTAFGVAFGMSGPVRSIYATLIAQLAHYESFTKREFFHDAAAYHIKPGERCLVRLLDNGNGTGELQVSFDETTKPAVRQGFLEFVGRHVESKAAPNSVTRRHAYHCHDCREAFADDLVRKRVEDKRPDLLCPLCESRTPLVNLLSKPNAASHRVAEAIDANAKTGRKKLTASWVIKGKKAEGVYDVFLSHNSDDKDHVENIARELLKVGLRPWFDKWDLAPGDAITDKLEWAIENVDCAALCFGPSDEIGKWQIMEHRAYLERWASGGARMVPVILPEVSKAPKIPLFVRQTLWVDMRDWHEKGHDSFYRLVCGIIGRPPGDSPLLKFNARQVRNWQNVDDGIVDMKD